MRRLIVHAGFHKTGTTTVQKTLRLNRQALNPHLKVILRRDMIAVCEAARAWSVSRDPLDAALFRYELAQLAEGWSDNARRPILMVSEDLSGHMPGRHGLSAYDAAPPLMQALAETLTEVRPDLQLQLFFSTRAERPWLDSCHAQNLRSARITLSRIDYRRTYRRSADLAAIVAQVAAVIAPWPVTSAALEACLDRPLGPLDPLLDLVGLPAPVRAGLTPHPPANRTPPPEVLDRLLALNRSNLDPQALRAAKQALAQKAS